MADSRQYITISGLYAEDVLGSFKIIRGFAPLPDLAAISVSYEMSAPAVVGDRVTGHQRPVDERHAQDIKRYLEEGRAAFIPEVILSVRGSFAPVVDARYPSEALGVSCDDGNGLQVRRAQSGRNGRMHTLRVERKRLSELAGVIRRIDGNHRLHLAEHLSTDSRRGSQYMAPFCLILLDTGEAAGGADPVSLESAEQNNDFTEAMLFYTINSKAHHLDSERAFQLVLGQPQAFFPAEDEFRTSPALHLTRLLMEGVRGLPTAQRGRLGETPLSTLHNAATVLVRTIDGLRDSIEAQKGFADGFNGALTDLISQLRGDHPLLCKASFFVELAALVWRDTEGSGTDGGRTEGAGMDGASEARLAEAARTLSGVGRWLGSNGLEALDEKRSMAEQLLVIYEAVQERVPKRVFLARWYPSAEDGSERDKAEQRLLVVEQVIRDLALEQPPISLKLIDLGTRALGTFPIHQEMYEAIRTADIILIDLSGVRPNVCVEAGYALEHHRKNRLLLMFEPTKATPKNPAYTAPPFDLNTFEYVPLGQASEILTTIKPRIRAIWEQAQTEGAAALAPAVAAPLSEADA